MDYRYQNIAEGILANLPYAPNPEQTQLIARLAYFVGERRPDSLFLLNGYAGTGKTSLTGALVRALDSLGRKSVLLAPTGRAAKVFAEYSGHPAFTIHRKIYRKRSYAPDQGGFGIAENKHTDTIFIVDEASMMPNASAEGAIFGTGRLLDDLIHYVYSSPGCLLILLGDNAQLPPVGFDVSPALSLDQLRSYGLHVEDFTLTTPVRQAEESGILLNATRLREGMLKEPLEAPRLDTSTPDFTTLSGEYMIETLSDCYDRDGMAQTIVITRSNKRATVYNLGIRNRILYREEELVPGDRLLVAKNNYFWSENHDGIDFIANGDMAMVQRVHGTESRFGLRFANVTLEFPDHNAEIDCKIVLDALLGDSPALPRDTQQQFFERVMATLEGTKAQRYKALKAHPYFNALQVKYAYAITCHKAQGGQWKNVFVDMAAIPPDAYTLLDFHRWLYTAITRATTRLHLIP